MAYIVVATRPEPINALKGRELEQNVGIALPREPHWTEVAKAIDLAGADLTRMRTLMRHHLLSFLAPLRPEATRPDWIAPAVRSDFLGLFATWKALEPIWRRFPHLFGSSANRTGRPPATTAQEAREAFGTDVLVIDGSPLREPDCTRGASTIMRISRQGLLTVHRSGAQDAAAGLEGDDYARRLDESH